jgi:hypothetical protein
VVNEPPVPTPIRTSQSSWKPSTRDTVDVDPGRWIVSVAQKSLVRRADGVTLTLGGMPNEEPTGVHAPVALPT